MYVCPECANESAIDGSDSVDDILVIKDSNGNPLQDGDTISEIKDLKAKGSSSAVKTGTKVKTSALLKAIMILIAKSMLSVR